MLRVFETPPNMGEGLQPTERSRRQNLRVFKLTHIVDVEKLEIIIKNSEKQTF